MISSCVVVAEAVQLDVGRGVAVVDHEARVDGVARCALDFGAALLAREEGRGPPERIAWRVDVDGSLVALGGPMGAMAIEVPPGRHRVRARAAMRGERFVAAPLALDPSLRAGAIDFSARASSVWGDFGVAGEARWVDVGVPVVVRVDPARDHEPLSLADRVTDVEAPVFVVDAGPTSPREGGSSPREIEASLAAGGARGLSALLSDLPLSVATAPNDASAIERLSDAARAALSASRSSDPITAAIGQRLTTAIATGFTDCRRDVETRVPSGWPSASASMIAGGIFEDAEAGCPRLGDLLAADHPDLSIRLEASAALQEALANARTTPGTFVASVERARAPLGGVPLPSRRRRVALIVLAAVALVLATVAAWRLRSRARG